MNVDPDKFKKLVVSLLDDEFGISRDAYVLLLGMMLDELYNDIVLVVDAVDDRFFLPKNHNV